MNTMHAYRIYETEFPGQQTQPIEFYNNDFGGNMNRPVLTDYTVVGYLGTQLWLRSKTGASNDVIKINFIVEQHSFNSLWSNKKASFVGELQYDYSARRWYYSWTCTKLS